ncbi:hypothetical protein N7532_007395 [Penicillium argentinense]|uniref:S-adenosyl-L-methionine-dependent methyltransferase n=1 Tax=Penicillium argentinense TaxID=1131581 RepID=A0A9W9F7V0_9EURO|nr:uncharacterized protein N7532_007395 [Penicillium argentinense]KAJ5095104.1 hypothetical protein N7532_007395 [Penicillium argentinense]
MEDKYLQPEVPGARDSDEDSDGASIKSTRSCASTTLPQIHENGRRYCSTVYFMPNDETELTRLNITHQIYLILLDGCLTTVPFNPKSTPRILDVGTGPGDWAIEMSAEFPNAEIIASDIGVFDSGLGHLSLPNVDFQLADAQSEWTYHSPFDLVHIRGLSGAFLDWGRIYRQAFAHLKPGGYIEVADSDPAGETISFGENTHSENSCLKEYTSTLREIAKEAGYPRDLEHLQTSALSAAGFVDVRVLERTIPIGLWPEDDQEKTLGKMALIALLEGLEAYALRPLTASGRYTSDEARQLCERVQEEVLGSSGLRITVKIVTGRRPASYAQKRQDVLARAMAKAKVIKEKDGFPGAGGGKRIGIFLEKKRKGRW